MESVEGRSTFRNGKEKEDLMRSARFVFDSTYLSHSAKRAQHLPRDIQHSSQMGRMPTRCIVYKQEQASLLLRRSLGKMVQIFHALTHIEKVGKIRKGQRQMELRKSRREAFIGPARAAGQDKKEEEELTAVSLLTYS